MQKFTRCTLALMLLACQGESPPESNPGEFTQGPIEVSERGRALFETLVHEPERLGESLGTLPRVPSTVDEAIELVTELQAARDLHWPRAIQVGTRHEGLFILSSAKTHQNKNHFDTGFLVSASTGEARWYHHW